MVSGRTLGHWRGFISSQDQRSASWEEEWQRGSMFDSCEWAGGVWSGSWHERREKSHLESSAVKPKRSECRMMTHAEKMRAMPIRGPCWLWRANFKATLTFVSFLFAPSSTGRVPRAFETAQWE